MEHHDDQSRQHVSAQSLSGEHGSGDARLRENEPREGSGTSAREKASPDSTACIGTTGGNISGNRPSGKPPFGNRPSGGSMAERDFVFEPAWPEGLKGHLKGTAQGLAATAAETLSGGPASRPPLKEPAQPSRFTRPGQRLAAATGLGAGLAAAASLARSLGRGLTLAPVRERLQDNLQRQGELEQADFAHLLCLWNVPEEGLARYIRERRREACLYGLWSVLALLATVASLVRPAAVPVVRLLATFACFSFLAASLLMCLAQTWRVLVCTRRRFVPFGVWLAGLIPSMLRNLCARRRKGPAGG
ncbi:MAG TPA: hypothetical protein H9894_05260 [Candidatus Desulfovibrio intestinipullorum]|uniref:Uncharacterized protein n=1 Tax=Candidatus Desulfovibrio intestinipullorum TaxID=2838536 RepID=A0A9D1PVP4_9BACT|nr:hypothetical protein [Candidatus Desulfovibrio intestinipullorum]